jgi:hypothetical protein
MIKRLLAAAAIALHVTGARYERKVREKRIELLQAACDDARRRLRQERLGWDQTLAHVEYLQQCLVEEQDIAARARRSAQQQADVADSRQQQIQAVRDQLGWVLGATQTVQVRLEHIGPAPSVQALACIVERGSWALGGRKVPTVPFSSLKGGEADVARANVNSGVRPR